MKRAAQQLDPDTLTAKILTDRGYRRVDQVTRGIARIDRPDWRDCITSPHATEQQAEDHYRRCYSRDTLVVKRAIYRQIPPSRSSITGHIPLKPTSHGHLDAFGTLPNDTRIKARTERELREAHSNARRNGSKPLPPPNNPDEPTRGRAGS